MCGIVGYVGTREAVPILLDGLSRLEYRGYDSAGVAVPANGRVALRKCEGRLSRLGERLGRDPLPKARAGVGHTRWATHGNPSDENAHPHADEDGRFAVVHNGIIENFQELRRELAGRGHVFSSQTDSEVVVHLLEEAYAGNLAEAVRRAASRLTGAYALVVLAAGAPDELVAVKQASPLVVGLGNGEQFLASDIPALLPYTRRVIVLEEGEMAVLRPEGVTVTDLLGQPVAKPVLEVAWELAQAERGGYPHFMLKEIHEQPNAIADTLRGRLAEAQDRVRLAELEPLAGELPRRLHLVACGTSYHAGLVGRTWIERWAGVPATVEVSSEFRYRDPLLDWDTWVIAISQSGETADTLAALREGRARGARVLAVTNVVGSSLAREADAVLYTWAGPEVAVASTKAYTTQLVALALLALELAQRREAAQPLPGGRPPLPAAARAELVRGLNGLAGAAAEILSDTAPYERLGQAVARWQHAFYIGRGLDYAVSLEGQLKLKEISYIHAEAYPAGELKHGTLALIEPGVPVVALATQPELAAKTASNIAEVRARGGFVLGLTRRSGPDRGGGTGSGGDGAGDAGDLASAVDELLTIPAVVPALAPVLAVIPLQLLAYYAAAARGVDIDKPRNLAKSVTVE